MKNLKIVLVMCLLIITAVFASGCRPLERPTPQQQPPGNDVRQAPGTPRTNGREGDLTQRADTIAEAVTNLEEVRSATVLITENTAIVGVTLNRNVQDVGRDLEERIEDVVTTADRQIDRVAVTADPDLITRIQNIADETGRGRPLSGFGREVEEILRRIIPNA